MGDPRSSTAEMRDVKKIKSKNLLERRIFKQIVKEDIEHGKVLLGRLVLAITSTMDNRISITPEMLLLLTATS